MPGSRQKSVSYVKDGTPIMKRNGSIRIRFTYDKPTGTYVSRDGKVRLETTCGQIHLSKKGAHIVQDIPEKKGDRR